MSEIIQTYNLAKPHQMIPMDRKFFYDEQFKKSRAGETLDKSVEVVNVFLFNEAGEFILQKRASKKNHNPNLLDKSIGGHIVCGDTSDFTVMVETVQELQVPSIVVRNHDDFLKTHNTLKDYLTTTAVIEYLDTAIITNKKTTLDGDTVEIINKCHMYIGVYGGSVKNIDNEAKGILFYSYEELKDEMEQFPKLFTDDLFQYMKKYEPEIERMINFLKKKS